MDFNDAARDIYQRYNGETSQSDIRAMLDDEIRSEEKRLRDRGGRGHMVYASAVQTAHKRILEWIETAPEFDTSDLVSFVAHSRHACVWAVLLGQRINATAKVAAK